MKMIRSSFLHPHVTPNLQDFCSSVEEVQKRHKSSVLCFFVFSRKSITDNIYDAFASFSF